MIGGGFEKRGGHPPPFLSPHPFPPVPSFFPAFQRRRFVSSFPNKNRSCPTPNKPPRFLGSGFFFPSPFSRARAGERVCVGVVRASAWALSECERASLCVRGGGRLRGGREIAIDRSAFPPFSPFPLPVCHSFPPIFFPPSFLSLLHGLFFIQNSKQHGAQQEASPKNLSIARVPSLLFHHPIDSLAFVCCDRLHGDGAGWRARGARGRVWLSLCVWGG